MSSLSFYVVSILRSIEAPADVKGPGALAVIATVGVTLHGTAALILQLFASERADDISLLPQVRLFPTLCCIGCGSPLGSLCGYFNPALSSAENYSFLQSWFS